MTARMRLLLFAFGALGLGAGYLMAARHLRAGGDYRCQYGDIVSSLAVYERHSTEVVNAVDYDYRGFDTLGEEFILFTSVVGVMMLLRREEGTPTRRISQSGKVPDRPVLGVAVRLSTLPAMIVTIVFGF